MISPLSNLPEIHSPAWGCILIQVDETEIIRKRRVVVAKLRLKEI